MSINYSEPATSAEVAQSLNANPSITPATQLAITQTLGLGPGVTVPVGSVNPDGSISAPEGVAPEMLLFDIGTNGGTYVPPANVQEAIAQSSVIVFNTDRNVVLPIPAYNGPASSADPESAQAPASAVSEEQVFDRVVQLGNGDDVVAIFDNRSVRVTTSGGNDFVLSSGGDDYVSGGDGQDNVVMGGGNDTAVVGWGVDNVDGGAGWDMVVFSQAGTDDLNPDGTGATIPGEPGIGDWSVVNSGGKLIITSAAGAVNGAELQNVEFVQFGEAALGKQFSVVVLNNEADANVARLYQTVFDRSADQSGVQYWLDAYSDGMSLNAITEAFLASPESNLVVAQTNAEFINQIYDNAFGRLPDEVGFGYWLGALDYGLSRSSFVDIIATSDEAKTTISNVQVFTDWV
jgi:hypothetical protein